MKLITSHITRYWYSDSVSTCHTEVHLEPRPRPHQAVLEFDLTVTPTPGRIAQRSDYFGNRTAAFSIDEPHRELVVKARSVVVLAPIPPANLDLSPTWEEVRDQVAAYEGDEALDALQFVYDSPHVPTEGRFHAFAQDCFPEGRHYLAGVADLSKRIFTEFTYDPRATTVSTPVAEVLESRRGVCQDYAHLMIACLRSLGLPARYMSGYVRTGRHLQGEDASHAWVSVWCPVLGWQDFDPTNDARPTVDHVTLAWGRHYSDVTPVKGVALGGGEQVINVSVAVAPE